MWRKVCMAIFFKRVVLGTMNDGSAVPPPGGPTLTLTRRRPIPAVFVAATI